MTLVIGPGGRCRRRLRTRPGGSAINVERRPGITLSPVQRVRAAGHPRDFFYGWRIVGAGMVVQMLISALMMQSFGAYAAILRDEFGWSKTLFSFAFSMTRVESGMLGPIQGWLVDTLGPRAMMRAGFVLLGAGMMLFSQIDTQWNFFLFYFLMSLGASRAGFMTLTTAVVNWFERRRALAIAIMGIGMAIGGLLVPLVVLSLEELGWRETAFGSGVLLMVVGLPLSQVVRTRPEDMGLRVDGVGRLTATAGAGGSDAAEDAGDYTAREALRTSAFWYLSLGHASALLVVGAVMVHLVLYVNEQLGYSLSTAGLVIAVMTAAQIVGMLLGGVLGDRVEKRVILVVAMLAHAVALLVLACSSTLWLVFVFAVLHGTAWGARGPLTQALRADYFGRTSFAKIMGFSSVIMMVGMTLGPIVAGVLADETGSYRTGFTVLAIAAGIRSIFFVLARPPRRPGDPVEARSNAPSMVEPAASETVASKTGTQPAPGGAGLRS